MIYYMFVAIWRHLRYGGEGQDKSADQWARLPVSTSPARNKKPTEQAAHEAMTCCTAHIHAGPTPELQSIPRCQLQPRRMPTSTRVVISPALQEQKNSLSKIQLHALAEEIEQMAGSGRSFAAGDAPARRCNLERFLEATTPVVASNCSSKEINNRWRQSDGDDPLPFFTLNDLWDAFRECSAYGIAVPLVLNDCGDGVVQYYVPYLSAIQLYSGFRRHVGPSRTNAEESDSDCCEDAGCDLEHETTSSSSSTNAAFSAHENSESSSSSSEVSSDGGESGSYKYNEQLQLLFEFLESEPPHQREPLADKVSSLSKRFPELKTLRSCDLSPASWISVAWYPIYRIPTGPTLRDLDACFLTYHSLSTQLAGVGHNLMNPKATTGNSDRPAGPRATAMWLPTFAMASYRLKCAAWAPAGRDRQLAASLAQAADAWLGLLRADHPDHRFFATRRAGAARRW